MKEKKTKQVAVKLTPDQYQYLEDMVAAGKGKSMAGAVQYLVSQAMIINGGSNGKA
jgi:hypothetical protein